jgi:phosphate:Na+ symporter
MATSIMNDSAYAYNIGKNLDDMARSLLSAREPELKNAEQKLVLDDTDIEDVLREDRG